MTKINPKMAQDDPKMPQDGQDGPKMVTRRPQDSSRWLHAGPQDGFKIANITPRAPIDPQTAQDGSKMAQYGPKLARDRPNIAKAGPIQLKMAAVYNVSPTVNYQPSYCRSRLVGLT
jgi:hypothetical protein